MMPSNKFLSTSLLNVLLQHNVHIQYSIVMGLYIQKVCTVGLHRFMLTLQDRHTEINKTNISLNKVSVHLFFALYYVMARYFTYKINNI